MKPPNEEEAIGGEKKARRSKKHGPAKRRQDLSKELKKVKEELEEQRKRADGYFERLMRLQAEFENYRKRIEKEKDQYIKFASENIVRELVDVAENLERAVEAGRRAAGEASESLLKGVEMTLKQLNEILRKEGLTPIDSVGKPFDPAYHEAVSRVPSKEHPENVVVKEYMRGYVLNSKVIRPAKVEVSAGDPEEKER